MEKKYTSYDELPLALDASELAQVLGVSRARAYELMHSQEAGLPVLRIGRRMVVPKDKLLRWIENQVA